MVSFFKDTGLDVSDLPERMSGEYELRSPIATPPERDMSDTAREHVKRTFAKRVYHDSRREYVQVVCRNGY